MCLSGVSGCFLQLTGGVHIGKFFDGGSGCLQEVKS